VLKIMFETGAGPKQIAEENKLLQVSDASSLKAIVDKVIKDNASVVTDYKNGKIAALQFLLGQCMKLSKGSGNPELLKRLLLETIK